jgi:acyl-CoA dehydrogenase
MLSLGLMLLLGGIAAYFRAKGWMIALAAFVGALIGGSV